MRFRDNSEECSKTITNLHEGHRNRLRERLMLRKFAESPDYEVLEYILTLSIKRRDTNEIAHRLVNQFGSLSKVFDASYDKLLEVKGITPTTAYFLQSIPYILRNYELSKIEPKQTITCAQDVFNTLGKSIMYLPNEEFYVMCLDAQNKMIAKKVFSLGGSSQVSIDTKDVVQFANKVGARKVVLIHNHPTSYVEPSVEDIETTKKLFMAFYVAGIELFDHVIVNSEAKYYSFAHSGYLKAFEKEYNLFIKSNTIYD